MGSTLRLKNGKGYSKQILIFVGQVRTSPRLLKFLYGNDINICHNTKKETAKSQFNQLISKT